MRIGFIGLGNMGLAMAGNPPCCSSGVALPDGGSTGVQAPPWARGHIHAVLESLRPAG